MNTAKAMDRLIVDLDLSTPDTRWLLSLGSLEVKPKPEKTKTLYEQIESFCMDVFGRVKLKELERLLFLGEIVLRERRAAILDMQREEDEDGSLCHQHSCGP